MSTAWQRSELQVITVTLYEQGFARYFVSFTLNGQRNGNVVWAKSREQLERRCAMLGYSEVVIEALRRDRFYAEKRQGASFIGRESKQTLYRVETAGDWILWPEYAGEDAR